MRRPLFLLLGTACLFLTSGFGCNSSPAPANSFSQVYATIIGPKCTNDFCHYPAIGLRAGGLDMNSRVTAYWTLVDQPCQSPACAAQGIRVIAGDPENSILYQKVSRPKCGTQMPASIDKIKVPPPTAEFSGNALGAEEQQLIYDWIWDGALNN